MNANAFPLEHSVFENWVRREPNSALGFALAAGDAMARASDARGSDREYNVSEEGWRGFAEWSAKAQAYAKQSLQLRPNSLAAESLIWSCLDSPMNDAQVEAAFNAAMRENPMNTHLHWAELTRRLKKWGGSHERAHQFARTVSNRSPAGSPLHFVIPLYHAEYWLYLMEFERKPDHISYWQGEQVKKEVTRAFDRSFGSPEFKPDRMSFNPAAPMAVALYMLKDQERLRSMLPHTVKHSNGRPWPHPWGYVHPNPMTGFRKAVRFAGGRSILTK